jgi:hypothetical protein
MLRRERLLVLIAVVVLVLFRSLILVSSNSLSFDSDEAVVGLMGKHLMDGRAFPLFYYGQNYMLAVEAWLAAPLFLLFGVSVTALKLPLLFINIAVGLLLVTLIERESGLRPALAFVASLFFLLAPPVTASLLLGAIGGNVEVFLYVLLLWTTRRRPAWFGFLLGLGFLQREFTIYGFIAGVLIQLAEGEWRQAERRRNLFKALRVAAEVWLVVQVLRPFASALGPGTSTANLPSGVPSNNVIEVLNRLCFDVRALAGGIGRLATTHWKQLFGLEGTPLYTAGLESSAIEGIPGSAIVFGAAALLLLGRLAMIARSQFDWSRHRFALYLSLVGMLSAGMLVFGRCGAEAALRYDVLSILGASGLAAWFFIAETNRWFRRAAFGVVVAWAVMSAGAHAQLWGEYVFSSHPPVAAKSLIIRHLEARGVKYAWADYWIAYYVSFRTNERIVVASDTFVRINEYGKLVDEHRNEAIRISRTPCENGKEVIETVFFCEQR